MKIDTSWKENSKMFFLFVLFFALFGMFRWYTKSADNIVQESPQALSPQSEDGMFTDEDFGFGSTTEEIIFTDEDF